MQAAIIACPIPNRHLSFLCNFIILILPSPPRLTCQAITGAMDTLTNPDGTCHIVAIPCPGRGHVNPMTNLCKILVSRSQHILVTFVVTEEWLGFIRSDLKPGSIRFATIPNVIPSEKGRAADFPGFYEAVMTKMEAPFEQLLDQLHGADLLLADVELVWGVKVGRRRNIPVALLWTASAMVFSVFLHFDLLEQNYRFPIDLSEHRNDRITYIPGIASVSPAELPTDADPRVLKRTVECVSMASKAQYLLFSTVYELEVPEMDALTSKFPFPVLSVGPAIPYLDLNGIHLANSENDTDYLAWLDRQPKFSVLYVSLGSFLSVTREQMDEIVAGLNDSGVRYLLVARGETSQLEKSCTRTGLVIPWCDQLRVLCHPSVAGFWTHCGWNSTLEALYAAVPMLTFPIFLDQIPNSKKIVEEWKTGWRVKSQGNHEEEFVTRKKIRERVMRFLDSENCEVKGMRKRAEELKEACWRSISEGGSSDRNLKTFIGDISQGRNI